VPVFEYTGLGEGGRSIRGVKDAESAKMLRTALRKEGVFLTEVLAQRDGGGGTTQRKIDVGQVIRGRISAEDVAIATRQLSTLVGANIPLVEALGALVDQVDHERLKKIVSQVKERVNEGTTLADALAAHPKVFNDLFVNMIRAGESSGALDVVLARLADFTENQAKIRRKVVGTMIYPAIMVVVGFGILIVLFTVVVPKVTKIFAENKMTLPLVTRILIGISDFARDYWYMLAATIALTIFAFTRWKASPKGRATWDRFVLKLPVFGPLVRMLAVTRFSRTLATLLKSGVPLLGSLDIVRAIVGNTLLTEVVEKARDSIREGESIAAPLKRSGQFPPLVYHMIAIGERTGQLEDMLVKVADAYDSQVDVRITALTTLLEPVMILLMGGTVAFIVFSILMPILQMNTVVR
jgi:general secretion pathway protein F